MVEPTNQNKWSSVLKLAISLLIGVGIIWYLQRNLSPSDKEQIVHSIANAKIFYVILTIILGALACPIRALRWKLMLEPMGYQPRFSTLTGSIFIMYLANLIFPRLGEVLRCSILQREENIPIEKSLGTMITERLVDVVGLAIIAGLGLLFEYDKLIQIIQQNSSSTTNSSPYTWLIIAAILGIAFIFILLKIKPEIKLFIIEKIKGLWDGLSSILKLKQPILFILYSFLIYTIYFLCTYLMYFAIEGTDILSLTSTFVVLTAGTIGVGVTQGGIGAYQFLVAKTLELYHIPKPIGLAYAWASWLIQTLNLVILGIFSWFYFMLRKK